MSTGMRNRNAMRNIEAERAVTTVKIYLRRNNENN